MDFGVGGVSLLWQAGFTGNPFRSLTDQEWEELALFSAPVAAAFYYRPATHLQIMGEAGAGKSSALRALVREARQAQTHTVYEYVPIGTETFRTVARYQAIKVADEAFRSKAFEGDVYPGAILCLDEAQRLHPRQRTRLIKLATENKVRLCLGTHENLEPLFAAAGLPLQTVTLAERTAEEFAAVWKQRLRHFARLDMPHAFLSDGANEFLRARFGNNLRQAERFLYHYFQEKVNAPGEITKMDLAGAFRLATESR